MDTRFTRGKSSILERSLTRPKTEVSVSAFALLFSEMVQYCQSRVYSVSELQTRLADMGQSVGASMLDVLVLRYRIVEFFCKQDVRGRGFLETGMMKSRRPEYFIYWPQTALSHE